MLDILKKIRVLPVIEIDHSDSAPALAEALAKGGVHSFEFTLRTPAALEALKKVKASHPDLMIGMGTIRNRDQAFQALDAGADFLVTPGTTQGLLDMASSVEEPVLLGAASASDVMAILDRGITLMKFFPAEPAGGVSYLKSLYGPLPDAMFCPTGGIARERVNDYLALDNVVCVGGSWVAPKALIAARDWDAISANARLAAIQSAQ